MIEYTDLIQMLKDMKDQNQEVTTCDGNHGGGTEMCLGYTIGEDDLYFITLKNLKGQLDPRSNDPDSLLRSFVKSCLNSADGRKTMVDAVNS